MTKTQLLKRLDDISASISRTPGALAVLALGSSGMDTHRMDEYSDLDFILVCEAGHQRRFLDDLDYLERVAPIGYRLRYSPQGYKLMFTDGYFGEFEVYEPQEMASVAFSRGRLVWKREGFDESLCVPQNQPVARDISEEWAVGEALTNLYVGLGRLHRGETLSAYSYIQCYAKDRMLELMAMRYPQRDAAADVFAIDRRFEQMYPECAHILPQILQGYDGIAASAKAILDFLCENYEVNGMMKDMVLELLEGLTA